MKNDSSMMYNIQFVYKNMLPDNSNLMGSSMYMGGMGVTGSMQQLQSVMGLQLAKNFSSGNFIVDTLIQLCIMTFVAQLFGGVKVVTDEIVFYLGKLKKFLNLCINALIARIIKKKVTKKKAVDIPFISDTKSINELYKAVSWYLSNNNEIDFAKETDLQYVYDKKLMMDNIKNGINITKIVGQRTNKIIKYKNHDINYSLDTELVTLYTDREKKRENYKIKLWTYNDEDVNYDIIEDFSKFCMIKYVESLYLVKWDQLIYTNEKNSTTWKSQKSNNQRKLETIILKDNLRDNIKSDIELFLNSESWYLDRDIAWTRGYLLYGLPGTGKSSLIKAISLLYKRHMHYLMLNEVQSDSHLFDLLKGINYKETILVIEDIDAMCSAVKSRKFEDQELDDKLKKREERKENKKNNEKDNNDSDDDNEIGTERDKKRKELPSGVTLSGLLNAMQGIFNVHGRILIMTTNRKDYIDDAILRSGRCDVKYKFDNCSREQIKELYYMFFNKHADEKQLIKIQQESYSPAHIAGIFLMYRNEPHLALDHLDDDI